MLCGYIYNAGGSFEKLYFDPLAVDSFVEKSKLSGYGYTEDVIRLFMRNGQVHEICDRAGIGHQIYEAQRPA